MRGEQKDAFLCRVKKIYIAANSIRYCYRIILVITCSSLMFVNELKTMPET